eukprot:CAMPEP_0113689584 /NCGR_PEP_ID=MMETSP0038_2-20120614/17262_1 /TAXON_ID=2898 /ORGANISM="Cryptomonas paramecium" /LENGTH=37 /DNA_ID=CAMNT_0000610705 /DNA_START=1 /DNA_END=114 /DNA_ORIENTATION=+ /assembly_acc=CAM_ASM_000170
MVIDRSEHDLREDLELGNEDRDEIQEEEEGIDCLSNR